MTWTDSRGNLTSEPVSGKSYTYLPGTDQLWVVNSPFTALSYDPLDRLAIIDSATDAKFAYDGTDTLAEYDGSNVLQHRYVFGPGMDEPIVEYDASGNRRFLSADERGSIISASDSSGALLSINTYDEYGRPGAGDSGRFQYTGQKWIGEAGLYDYKARSYLAHLGIFAQTDPVGYDAGANLYAYVLNDPINLADPFGLTSPGCPQPPGEIGVCGHRGGSNRDQLSNVIPLSFTFQRATGIDVYRAAASSSGSGGGAAVSSGHGFIRRSKPKPICGAPLKEPGQVIFQGTTGSLTFGLGGSLTKGTFTNVLTGTSGTFISYSFNVGIDIGGGSVTGTFRDLASFNGGNDNTFSGAGKGPFTTASVTSRDLNGNEVGNSQVFAVGPAPVSVGSSFSVTELTSINQPGC